MMVWGRQALWSLFLVLFGCQNPVTMYVQSGMYDEPNASSECWWQERDRLEAAHALAKSYAKSELQWVEPRLVTCERSVRRDTDEPLYSCRVYPPRQASFTAHTARLICSLEHSGPVCWSVDSPSK